MGMKIDIAGILKGAWNSIFVKDHIEKLSAARIAICRGCSMNSEHATKYLGYKSFRPDFHCTNCGCNLDMKTRCLSCECPLKKWLAVATEEEGQLIQTRLENEGESQ